MDGLFTDQSFLHMFNFPLEKGNPATALAEPNGLVLKHEAAQKIFGEREALGQTITVKGYGEFVVTGVLKKLPSKTHFEFEMLGSMTAIPGFERQGVVSASLDDWNNYYGSYIYFKLKEEKDTDEVNRALTEINKKYYTGLKLET